MSYFLLNKELDYLRGFCHNCAVEGSSLTLVDKTRKGIFISRVFDSHEGEMVWHRLKLLQTGAIGRLSLGIYASEETSLRSQGVTWDILSLLRSEDMPYEKKKSLCKAFLQKRIDGEKDMLLHEVKGRYLWFFLEFQCESIDEISIFFPKETWMKYLPQVYQTGAESQSFTERFLGVFQSFYDELTEEIEQSHYNLSPFGASPEMLLFLGEILSIEQIHSFSQEKLRLLLDKAPSLFAKRGTKAGLLAMLKLYTGEEAYILEENQEPHHITVLLREEFLVGGHREVVTKLTDSFVPANLVVKLMDLRDFVLLGEPLYLGVNSKVNAFEGISLDGLARLDYTVIGDENKEGKTNE